ncbi:MAG: o-succinylbenzoate synthase, partial [Lentisphaeria bacterium]|nr:o-succinylbenzoate synthase [Lentisphaeria bacterium]
GSRLGTGIGVAMRVAAAALPNCTYPADIGFSASYLPEEITEAAFGLQDGCFFNIPHDTPGLGVQVVPQLLKKYLGTEYEL